MFHTFIVSSCSNQDVAFLDKENVITSSVSVPCLAADWSLLAEGWDPVSQAGSLQALRPSSSFLLPVGSTSYLSASEKLSRISQNTHVIELQSKPS